MGLARRMLIGRWLWLAPLIAAGVLAVGVAVSMRVIEGGQAPGDVQELEMFLTAIDQAADDAAASGDATRLIVTARLARTSLQARQDVLETTLGPDAARELVDAVVRLADAAEELGNGAGDRQQLEAAKAGLLAAIVEVQDGLSDDRQQTIADLEKVILALVAVLAVGGLIAAFGTWTSEHTLSRLRKEEIANQQRLAAQNRDLAHAATHDALTGLLNRAGYFDQLASLLAGARQDESRVAVIIADMDRFKTLNDIRGHQTADSVLKLIADRFGAWAGDDGAVGRLGGDEFAIAMRVQSASALDVDLKRLEQAIGERVSLDGVSIQPSVSIGVSLFPEDGTDVDVLTRHADLAMYQAKHAGGGQCALFSPGLADVATARRIVEVTLADAIERDELLLEYQPVVSLKSGDAVSIEALVRWCHPEKGIILPGEFVPVAEESGSMIPLGAWVIREALGESRFWWDQGWRVPVSINLSPVQLRSADFAQRLREALDAAAIPPGMVALEITESTALDDSTVAIDQLRTLRALGVSIALDDFGSGRSSLARLERLPLDVLKIDRALIAALEQGDASPAIVEAAVMLGKRMGLVVVAEGVETSAQLSAVKLLGCDAAQGHYLQKPVSSAMIRDLLAGQSKKIGLPAA